MNKPPKQLLLCLDDCYGEFYLPLDSDESQHCPNRPEHTVAIYAYEHTISTPMHDEDE